MKNAVAITRATELVPALKFGVRRDHRVLKVALDLKHLLAHLVRALSFARLQSTVRESSPASAEPETLMMVFVRICV
jgi:hypothetical protein